MKFKDISVPVKANSKRVGRGIGSGRGKTAGRGTKGQKARTGHKLRLGFEGGQNSLMKRLPKNRGFDSRRPRSQLVHSDQLNRFPANTTVTRERLHKAGLIKNLATPVKIVLREPLKHKLTVEGIKFSRSLSQRLAAVPVPGEITAKTTKASQ